MNGAVEMHTIVGCDAVYHVRELRFNVRIVNVRDRFGAEDVFIIPESGSGGQWVSRDSVTGISTVADRRV